MEQDTVIASLAALAHPLRLQVFRALVVSGPSGLTPGVMQEGLQIPAATLSFHLKELTDAWLVTRSRSGRHLIYRADLERADALLDFMSANCSSGARA